MKIGISIGDINGVGPEVIIKALADSDILRYCTPIVYGSSAVITYYRKLLNLDFDFERCNDLTQLSEGTVYVYDCWEEDADIEMGKATKQGGKYAFLAMDKATDDLLAGSIDAFVTAPINKNAMQLTELFPYPGHTEYLADKLKSKNNLMLMVSDRIRVAVVTNHVPIGQVTQNLTQELVKLKLDMLYRSLQKDFSISKPTIAVLGLNPHAGDGGVIGTEEITVISPVINMAIEEGKNIIGPFPADGFFGSDAYSQVDGVLAMYHDQGLIPFKILSFGAGVNFSAGMDYIRTSVDHGTAYEIVGKNIANSQSLTKAIFQAIDIYKNRSVADSFS